MAILPILTVPNPLLAQKSRPVREDEFGPALEARMSDMAETMYAAPGVGLAGVQVGDLRRILVVDLSDGEDENGEKRRGEHLVMMCNPEILERSRDKITWEEGCLSVPELWEDVTRPDRVRVKFRTPDGAWQDRWFEEYPAVIVQHEMDHLDGVVILDKISRLKRSRYLKKVRKRATSREEESASL
jgi:peptide deformylase